MITMFMRMFGRVVSQAHYRCFSSLAFNTSNTTTGAVPVMLEEVLNYLAVVNEHTVLDMTFGSGGHSEALLSSVPGIKLLVLDRDPVAISKAEVLASKYTGRVIPLLGCFSDLPKLLRAQQIKQNSIDGILMDLGCSTIQLSDANRGFSVHLDGPLDMRMNNTGVQSITAADVLDRADVHALHRILKVYGGIKRSKLIANALVSCRYKVNGIKTTQDLKVFLDEVVGDQDFGTINKVFRALRVFVNNEINELNFAMHVAEKFLKNSGRLVVLTYNYEEDLIVKRHLQGNMIDNNPNPEPLKFYSQKQCLTVEQIEEMKKSPWQPLTKHVLQSRAVPQDYFSKHVKMRAAVKL